MIINAQLDISLLHTLSEKQKYIITAGIPKLIFKKISVFFFTEQKNERKEHDFDNKKFLKSDFHKNRKIFHIHDIDINKILVSKKKHMVKIIHLYTLLDIMIMKLLEHYV